MSEYFYMMMIKMMNNHIDGNKVPKCLTYIFSELYLHLLTEAIILINRKAKMAFPVREPVRSRARKLMH